MIETRSIQDCNYCGGTGQVYGERLTNKFAPEDCNLCFGTGRFAPEDYNLYSGVIMDYKNDFYVAYEKYLQEPTVRKAHDWIFQIAMLDDAFQCVVDFGCGQANEFSRYARPWVYVGMDANAGQANIKADYRTFDLEKLNVVKPSAFVSLFSSEITAPTKKNYQFYEQVFAKLPVKTGLVSGFFYANKLRAVVEEPYGIKSHQTLEAIDSVNSDVFTEKRIILPVPSDMFGKDVYEVWKIFERK